MTFKPFFMVRHPAVAGRFYEASPEALRAQVHRYHDPSAVRRSALVAITPHAGLMYSGPVAGAVYSHLLLPHTVILIGPNHTGQGPAISVYPEGSWLLPGKEFLIHRSMAEHILSEIPKAQPDESAHSLEHCLEVQLPFFMEQADPDLHIVPIVLGTTNPDTCRELGLVLAGIIRQEAARSNNRDVPLIVATTDMTHYESDEVTRHKDAMAVQAIRNVDPEALDATARANRITMCGLGPVMTALHSARALHLPEASLIHYDTSAEVSGDFARVVGYAGFLMYPEGPGMGKI